MLDQVVSDHDSSTQRVAANGGIPAAVVKLEAALLHSAKVFSPCSKDECVVAAVAWGCAPRRRLRVGRALGLGPPCRLSGGSHARRRVCVGGVRVSSAVWVCWCTLGGVRCVGGGVSVSLCLVSGSLL